MSDYPRPAGLDLFAKCPVEGCYTRVLAPLLVPLRCRLHGGSARFEIPASDPFGNPLDAERADVRPAT